MEKLITYNGAQMKVACDEKCEKAFGWNGRPMQNLSGDDADIVWLSDNEVGIAPANPGTYEGGEAKPVDKNNIPNKWCVRECERCAKSARGEQNKPLALKNWNNRIYNQPWKHEI